MSLQVVAGAAMLGVSIPLAWWAAASARTGRNAVSLLRPEERATNLRAATLERSARERAVAPAVAAMARRARRMTPGGMVTALEQRLTAAGMQGQWTIERVLAAKLAGGIAGLLLGFFVVASAMTALNLLVAVFALVVGWFGVDVILHGRADDRRKTVQRELPDVMDQITIAVEAGLGFEAAMARAADGDSILAVELSRTLQDIQLGMPRAEALDGLAGRCSLPELRHFVAAVRQAERYGLPIANVLRVQASELRDKRRQRAEEHAMKLPVKVLFPLIFCILPTLFIVILGPAAIRIANQFNG